MSEIKLAREKWFAVISEQEKSNLTVSEFCRGRNLKTHMLYYYRQALKKKESPVIKVNNSSETNLMPIKIKTSVPAEHSLDEITFIASNGLQCVLPGDTSIIRIKQIIEILMTC